jgi:hypothetical protein
MRPGTHSVVAGCVSVASLITALGTQAAAQTVPAPSGPGVVAAPPAVSIAPAPAAPAVGPTNPPPPAAQPQPVPPPPAAAAPAAQPGAILPATPAPQPAQPVPQPPPVGPEAPPAPVAAAPPPPAVGAPSAVQPEPALQPPPVNTINLQPQVEAEVAAAPEPQWYDLLSVQAFVDTYYSHNVNTPKPQDRNRFRAFDQNNGFGLSWAGLNLGVEGDAVGGTLALRFGPSAARLAGTDTGLGLQYVKQAFATWKPGGKNSKVTLDLGKFDTIYGAEVADSQLNFNYTRGLLYWLAQPAFHTGLRANFNVVDEFWITALVANGWNNSFDQNAGKTFGVQFNAAVPNSTDPQAPPVFDVHLGYLVGPEQQDWGEVPGYCPDGFGFDPASPEECVPLSAGSPAYPSFVRRDAGAANSEMRHLIDLVMGVHPTPQLALVLNADIGFDRVRDPALLYSALENLPGFETQSWWGVNLMGRYQFSSEWAGALRGEIVGDPDARATADGDPFVSNVPDLMLYSATLTGEFAPTPNLILRLDGRLDAANEEVFPELTRSYEATQFTATLGAVVTTN